MMPDVTRPGKRMTDILQVTDMLRQRVSPTKITITLKSEGYLKPDRLSIMKNARAVLASEAARDIAQHYHQLLSNLDDLYIRCFNIQDYRECRQILNDQHRIFLMFQNAIQDHE